MGLSLAMLFVVIWSALLLSVLGIGTNSSSSSSSTGNITNAAIETSVLQFAHDLERWLDVERRPCDDFFGYVCGRLQNATRELQRQQQQQQQQTFEQFVAADEAAPATMTTTTLPLDAELKLKHFYASCSEARSLDALQSSYLYRMSGAWPAIDESAVALRRRRNMTWLSVLGAFHDAGREYFFRQRVEMKSNKRVVLLEPNAQTRYTLRKFEQLATDVMQEYAVEAGRARLVALETLSFERARREILKRPAEAIAVAASVVAAETQSSNDVECSYAELKGRSMLGSDLKLDWDAHFRKVLGKPPQESDLVSLRQLPQLKQLFGLLQRTTLTRLLNWLWIDYLMDKSVSECASLAKLYFEPVYEHIVARSSLDKAQLAQMYASVASGYEQHLLPTPWIDEMTHQNSKQFLGRLMQLTLNGDAKLDADYAELSITKRNFFRNLEKCQRFIVQQRRRAPPPRSTAASSAAISTVLTSQAVNEFMRNALSNNALPRAGNLTAPLSYVLLGENFAEYLIAGGGNTGAHRTPGAWRSMDSERDFAAFEQCVRNQQQPLHPLQSQSTRSSNASLEQNSLSYNFNDLLLKLLAQAQTLRAYGEWQQLQEPSLLRRLDAVLAAERKQLSLRKLYFIGSLLTDCQQHALDAERREFVHSYLRNSPEFARAFDCRVGDALYARNVCKL